MPSWLPARRDRHTFEAVTSHGPARLLLALVVCLAAALLPATAQAQTGGPLSPEAGLPEVDLAQAAALAPSGFEETVQWTGLTNPTVIRFAPDGRVFVAEQTGLIKVFDNIDDPSATVYADLRSKVHHFWDRGLLGMALDPAFTSGRPFVYVLYAHDAAIGGTAPRWGDQCPSPPGATGDGCVISGRLSKLSGGSEQVLIEDWCQQYPSHSVGSLEFGADGALYASSGDGASFNFADYGQDGNPVNPCGDPPGGVGATLTPPTAEGGALRSQDTRTGADPASLDGTIIRVNPDTGAALPDNPNAGSSDPNVRRIVGHRPAQPLPLHLPPGHQRPLPGRRRLGHLGGDQPPAQSCRAGGELRLALLRGHAADVVLRQPQPERLREPLLGRRGRRDRAAVRLQPRVQGHDGDLPDRQLVDRGR